MLFLHVGRCIRAPILDKFTRILQRRQQLVPLPDQLQHGGRVGGGDESGYINPENIAVHAIVWLDVPIMINWRNVVIFPILVFDNSDPRLTVASDMIMGNTMLIPHHRNLPRKTAICFEYSLGQLPQFVDLFLHHDNPLFSPFSIAPQWC